MYYVGNKKPLCYPTSGQTLHYRMYMEGKGVSVEVITYSVFPFKYKKPKEILTIEHELLQEVKKLKGTNEGDVDCKTQ